MSKDEFAPVVHGVMAAIKALLFFLSFSNAARQLTQKPESTSFSVLKILLCR